MLWTWVRLRVACGWGLALCFVHPSLAHGSSRAITLFPDEELARAENRAKWGASLSANRLQLWPPSAPCYYALNTLPLVYLSLKFGASCTVQTGDSHFVAVDLFPELSLRNSALPHSIRPALLFGATGSYRLTDQGVSSAWQLRAFASGHAKFAPSEEEAKKPQEESIAPGLSPIMLQRWGDVLDSAIRVGIVASRVQSPEETWGFRVTFTQGLPLGLRKIGALAQSAPLHFKAIDVALRKETAHFWWGGGLGYAVLAFDEVRFSFPFPLFQAGYHWD